MNHQANGLWFVAVGLPLFSLIILLLFWSDRRARRILRDWAGSHGWKLISEEHCWFMFTPFWWRTSKAQIVFRIKVEDFDRNVLTGYARIGGWFLGVLTDDVLVKWDQPYALSGPKGFPITPNAANDQTHDPSR